MSERGPWFICDSDAVAREALVYQQFAATLKRRVVREMSDEDIAVAVLSDNYTIDEIARILRYRERVRA
jgi:hypothetical protein